MTGRGDVARAVRVVAWLRIDCGHHTRPWTPDRGSWTRHHPAADYVCLRCGRTDAASGDQVPAFVNTIRHTHRAVCPAAREDS